MSSWLNSNVLVACIKNRHIKCKIIVIVYAPEYALVKHNRTPNFKAPYLLEEAMYRCCGNFGGLIRSVTKECISVSNESNENRCIPMNILMSFALKLKSIDLELPMQVS